MCLPLIHDDFHIFCDFRPNSFDIEYEDGDAEQSIESCYIRALMLSKDAINTSANELTSPSHKSPRMHQYESAANDRHAKDDDDDDEYGDDDFDDDFNDD